MDIASGLRLRQLPHRQVHRVILRAREGLAVFQGRLWVTQLGDRRDHIVDAGDTVWSESQVELLVQALADSRYVQLHTIDTPDVRPSPQPALPARRPSAYELTRVARDMRHREVARTLVRAAGAVSYLSQVLWRAAARLFAQVGSRRPAGSAPEA